MDSTSSENAPFFSTLFRHMQMSAMLGCPSVAAEIGKILLSLDPLNDRYNILLTLDFFFLSSGKYNEIFNFVGIRSRSTENKKMDPWGLESLNFLDLQLCFSSLLDFNRLEDIEIVPYERKLSLNNDNNGNNNNNNENNNDYNNHNNGNNNNNDNNGRENEIAKEGIKLCYLPNWWFSAALASYLQEKSSNDVLTDTTSTSPSLSSAGKNVSYENQKMNEIFEVEVEVPKAEEILLKALSIWPYLLEPLLKKAGVQTTSSHWRAIFTHPVFATARTR